MSAETERLHQAIERHRRALRWALAALAAAIIWANIAKWLGASTPLSGIVGIIASLLAIIALCKIRPLRILARWR